MTEVSKPMDRFQIQKVSGAFIEQENAIKHEISDIDREIERLHQAREKKEREAFIAHHKGKALQVAVRYMEDHDII